MAMATRSAIIMPPLPPMSKPTPMKSAVMKARSMAVRTMFIRFRLPSGLAPISDPCCQAYVSRESRLSTARSRPYMMVNQQHFFNMPEGCRFS